jgi:SM-20-related protein
MYYSWPAMNETTPNDAVTVTLLISGGHRQALSLDPDSDLFRALLSTTVDHTPRQRDSFIFNLPLDSGEFLLIRGSDIHGIVTTVELEFVHQPVSSDTSPDNRITKRCRWHVEYDVLEPLQLTSLMEYVKESSDSFEVSRTSSGVSTDRQSRFLASLTTPIRSILEDKLRRYIEMYRSKLALMARDNLTFEFQLTTHNNGDYFLLHRDNGGHHIDRWLSFVYYFHWQPRAYTGGELLLYDTNFYSDGAENIGELALSFDGPCNSLILFPSECYHEVRAVKSTGLFIDGRFTINGWISGIQTKVILE